jgi:sec-independent protein translocase protein TatA
MFPSHVEILVIFLVVLLLFGARRIPEMAQGLGKGIREFRKAVKDVKEEVDVTSTMNQPTQTIAAASGQVARQDPVPAPQPAVAQPVAPAPAAVDRGSEARS